MKEHMTETVNTLLDAAVTATDADEALKYANAAKTVTEAYKLAEDAKIAEKKADNEHEERMTDIQNNADKRKDELALEKEKLKLEERKWYDLTPKEIAMNNKDKLIEGLKVVGGVLTAVAGGYIGYKTAERKNETVKYGINAATNFSQSDVLNGKPLEVVDRANKIADD